MRKKAQFPDMVGSSDLAAMFGFSKRWINYLVASGVFTVKKEMENGQRFFDPIQAVQDYISYERNKAFRKYSAENVRLRKELEWYRLHAIRKYRDRF